MAWRKPAVDLNAPKKKNNFGSSRLYPESIKFQRLIDMDQLLHLSHLSHFCVALVNNLGEKQKIVKTQEKLPCFSWSGTQSVGKSIRQDKGG